LIFHYRMLPVGTDGDVVTLAVSEPMRQVEQGNLRLLLGKRFKMVLATPSSIHALIKKHLDSVPRRFRSCERTDGHARSWRRIGVRRQTQR
jgi:hypothetical protein